jgi:hypothetical protein
MENTELTATTWEADTPEELPILTVGELLENLKDEHPDTPFAYLESGRLTYIVGASHMWETGKDGDLRVFTVF